MDKDLEKKKDMAERQVKDYMKYSGMGFQIAGSLAAGLFIGYWLDKWVKTPQPYFMLALGLVFLFGGMYVAFKDFLKPKK